MQDINISDSYDNDVFLNLTISKSITSSLKPKLITAIEKTHHLSQSSFHSIKKVQSFPIINHQLSLSTNRNYDSIDKDSKKTPPPIEAKIKKAIELIKETTVYKDTPINVIQLFQKASRLSEVKHQNKKIIKFLQICERDHCNLFIQRNQWTYISSFFGKGIMILPDGRKIKGMWQNCIPLGKVTVQYPNQSLYYGSINSQLQKSSDGYIYFKNGQKLQAEFMMGKMIGKGTYYNSKGEVEKDYRFDNGMLMSSKKA